MNIVYFVGALVLLIILGYPYVLLVVANKQQGATKMLGWTLSGLFVLVLLLVIVLYQTGLAQAPKFSLMPERPTSRIRQGMSGYVTGMMLEDERAIDEFINILKANPELYQKFRERLK